MRLYSLLLALALTGCSATGDPHDRQPAAMTMGAAQSADQGQPGIDSASPRISDLVQNQEQEDIWRTKVLNLLTRMVELQEDMANHQTKVVQQIGLLVTQGSQQIQDLQNMARHQSLIVENHQALLLQTSRIATQLQDNNKKPAVVSH